MPLPLLFKYPLDRTGKSATNLVLNEPHSMAVPSHKAFVTNGGPFYVDSVVVKNADTGDILAPYTQYLILQPYQEASVETGLDVASIIYVIDNTITGDVLVNYQVVGGEYSWSVYALKEMLEALNLDERPVAWGDILGKPNEYPPSPHLHDLGDTFGWEYVTQQLEGIRNAILIGDAAGHDELRQQLTILVDELRDAATLLAASLEAHKANQANPHVVTKTQVGLGMVENWTIATLAEAQAGVVDNKYMTPLKTSALAVIVADQAVSAHYNDKNNPHAVTKVQIGLGSVDNYPTASQAEAEAGIATTRFMTPLRTKQAITLQAVTPLNAFIARRDNPHVVTKVQVGLGNVDNYLTATQAESEAGIANNRFMTPLGVKQAVTAQIGNALTLHTDNMSNPHNTTKAHVGLGSVANYAVASQAEAEVGTTDLKYMTPLKTKQAITLQAVTPLNTFIARRDNPHVVTATQVGLGSVANYAMATQLEAEAGVSSTTYMNPLRTKQAITAQAIAPLNAFIARRDNPHVVTKAQVGLSLVGNYGFATQLEAEAGVSTTDYMNPLTTKQAITLQAVTPLNAFIARRDNPHVVTASQVGLGSVSNYAMATQTEAEAGAIVTKYMNPLNVKQAITVQALGPLNTFIARRDNPHVVTKAQVGLSLVGNYGFATQAEAEAGIITTEYMNPLTTKQAITAQALAPLNTFIARRDNPHVVTKAQVSLGSVENYGLATLAEAQVGTSSVKYMTPLRTKDAITYQAVTPLNTHIANSSNPHGVTAAQVGAYTTAQVTSLLAGKLATTGTAANSNLLQGSTVAGILASAYAAVGTMGKRALFTASYAPTTEGAIGDVWFQY